MTRTRRHRRTAKQVLKHGPTAKRPHKRIKGRTGKIFQVYLKSLIQKTKNSEAESGTGDG